MQDYGSGFAKVYNELWRWFSVKYAPVIHKELGEDGDMSVLDLCCGTGQLCSYFLDQGYFVTGLDLSKDMLRYAVSNNQAWVDEGRFVAERGDARRFSFERRFGAVTALFDALNHLEDEAELQACFECAYRALREDGTFVFDLNTARGLRGWNHNAVQEREDVVLVQRGMYVEERRKAYMEILGFADTGGGRYERFKELIFNTAFAVRDVENLLRKVGFTEVYVRRATEDFEPAPEPELEDRVFFVARRA